MEQTCAICDEVLASIRPVAGKLAGMFYQLNCPRCGEFEISHMLKESAAMTLNDDPEKQMLLSHYVRKLQRSNVLPEVTSSFIKNVLEHYKLPMPAEQADNLVLWLGRTLVAAEAFQDIDGRAMQAIIGGATKDAVHYIASHLAEEGLISYGPGPGGGIDAEWRIGLKFLGWKEFQRLESESIESRIVFMAMKFNMPELDLIVEQVFRPAVAATGFELRVLTDVPVAGLIDDRMRVEIRRSRFMLADITHSNLGAYWEAGFAEGLGKPVIYTCKKSEFTNSHFDTNHHLTVMWHDDHDAVAAELKNTIRATLPDEAKMDD